MLGLGHMINTAKTRMCIRGLLEKYRGMQNVGKRCARGKLFLFLSLFEINLYMLMYISDHSRLISYLLIS